MSSVKCNHIGLQLIETCDSNQRETPKSSQGTGRDSYIPYSSCAICFSELISGEEYIDICMTCNKAFHKASSGRTTCPHCRNTFILHPASPTYISPFTLPDSPLVNVDEIEEDTASSDETIDLRTLETRNYDELERLQ